MQPRPHPPQPLVNKVAASALVTFDLESIRPKTEGMTYDLKQNLYLEQILREKDFRAFLTQHDWTQYQGRDVALYCSTEAIIPLWAYMLVAGHLAPFAASVVQGSPAELESMRWVEAVKKLDADRFHEAKLVIKGCGEFPIPVAAYVALTLKLNPVVSSLMFGEPCSTVPLFKHRAKDAPFA